MTAPTSHLDPQGTAWGDRLAALAANDRPGTPADKQARAIAADPFLWAHPERTARDRAHRARQRGTCAHDSDPSQPCDCPPEPEALAAAWAGLARMAAARAAAGQPLTELDRQALHLQPGGPER